MNAIIKFLCAVWDLIEPHIPFLKQNFDIDIQLYGKTAIVTGSNTGIGKATVKELYKRGAQVIMACRDVGKAQIAAKEIELECKEKNNGKISVVELDLSSFESIRTSAAEILRTVENIHILINNAAVLCIPKSLTVDGFEAHFAVNHLGHFLFTNLLLDKIISSSPARIVNVTSDAHVFGHIDWDDINYDKSYGAYSAYSRSKLANILFTMELSKKLIGTGVTTYAPHPGVVLTENGFQNAVKSYPDSLVKIVELFFSLSASNPDKGYSTVLYCALSEEVKNQSGFYYTNCHLATPFWCDQESAKKLWEVSTKLVHLY